MCTKDLDFKLIYDGSVSYAGYFSALNQSITLQGVDDTVYHELGHFLAWIAGNVDKRSEFATIYKSEKAKYTGVRKAYVTQNASEYFAESYRDYILSGSNLKKSRPKTYAYVRNAVQTIQNSPDRITKIKNVYKVIWKKMVNNSRLKCKLIKASNQFWKWISIMLKKFHLIKFGRNFPAIFRAKKIKIFSILTKGENPRPSNCPRVITIL